MASAPDTSHWVPDEFVLNCQACSVAFGLTTRRHHCRNCGEVFCNACVSQRAILPDHLGYGDEKQRVCPRCVGTLEHKREKPVDEEESLLVDSLKRLYRAAVKPLEIQFRFGEFSPAGPPLSDAYFDAAPMVLLVGQYSVGKTSFIRTAIGNRDFPGQRIGPEPTTDKFTIVTRGCQGDRSIPGNALAVQADKPFTTLQRFGGAFLNKLECAEVDVDAEKEKHNLLTGVTFVDTPGVLSGEKQRIGRAYDYPAVVEWFAERCDRILLFFDAHKLDISDEFQSAISALRGHDDKIRVILNKADMVDEQALMRIHGALMWSLGKVIKTPEVVRVYVGSFWDQPIKHKVFEELFARERADLISDIAALRDTAIVRKVNDVVKRARSARVHALIIDHLRAKLPTFFGRASALDNMFEHLEKEFLEISRKHRIPLCDFPRIGPFREKLMIHCESGFDDFPINQKMMTGLEEVLSSYIPRLLARHSRSA